MNRLDPSLNAPSHFPSITDVREFTQAARRGDEGLLRKYIEQFGQNIINSKDNMNMTALHAAASQDQVGAIHLLLDNGADTEARSPSGVTPIIYAAYDGKTKAIEALLDRGANINAVQDGLRTALMTVALQGFEDTAITLIERGAKLDLQDSEGETAATLASWGDNTQIIDLLHAAEKARMARGIDKALKTNGRLMLKKPVAKVKA